MTFFEQELRKIVEAKYPDATFVGRACYVPLSATNRAKIQLEACGTVDHYDALQLTILNRNDGRVDSLTLRFKDVLGVKKVSNPNFREGVSPHAWTYRGKTEWYAYQPNNEDYRKLTDAVGSYLDVFRTPEREVVKENSFTEVGSDSTPRIICDIFEKGEKSLWDDDPNSPINRKVLAIKNMYAWLYDAGILADISIVCKESPTAVCFALDTKDLQPYRQQMESSGVADALLAVEHIFDREYSPCVYSGVVQLAWPMSSYRNVDGCVGRSWECDLIKGLNTDAIYAVSKVREEQGIKAAVRKLFSFYVWQEPERFTPTTELMGISAEGESFSLDPIKLKAYIEDDMILEFASAADCLEYFNTYDGQEFHSVEELKSFQGKYGFGIGEKWYHINFDEALDVRVRPSLDAQISGAASCSSHADTSHTSVPSKEPER